jgi:hypothetical protein
MKEFVTMPVLSKKIVVTVYPFLPPASHNIYRTTSRWLSDYNGRILSTGVAVANN